MTTEQNWQVPCQICGFHNWFSKLGDKVIYCRKCGGPTYNVRRPFDEGDMYDFINKVKLWTRDGVAVRRDSSVNESAIKNQESSSSNQVSHSAELAFLKKENEELKVGLDQAIQILENLQRKELFLHEFKILADNFYQDFEHVKMHVDADLEQLKNIRKGTEIDGPGGSEIDAQEDLKSEQNLNKQQPSDSVDREVDVSKNPELDQEKREERPKLPKWLARYNALSSATDRRIFKIFKEDYAVQMLITPQDALEGDWMSRRDDEAKTFSSVAEDGESTYWHIHDDELDGTDFLVLDRQIFSINRSSLLSIAVCYNFNTDDEEQSKQFNPANYILKDYKVIYPAEIIRTEGTNEWLLSKRGRMDFAEKDQANNQEN
ncbi:MAG: hypothetical protein AAGD25_11250 [Cyanobacteria bacterium P01_F01_bin.150]